MNDEAKRMIDVRRADTAFTDRLVARMDADKVLLARMAGDECKEARLVESQHGGTVLIYECECGARLLRTRTEAERDATQENTEESTDRYETCPVVGNFETGTGICGDLLPCPLHQTPENTDQKGNQ